MAFVEHISHEELALHARQALSEEESATVRAHLDECFFCQAGLAEISGDLSLVAQSVEQQLAPEGSRQRFNGSIAATAPAPRERVEGKTVPTPERHSTKRHMNWVLWAAATARRYAGKFINWIPSATVAARRYTGKFMNWVPSATVAARRHSSGFIDSIPLATATARRYTGKFMNWVPSATVAARRYSSGFIDSIPWAAVAARRPASRPAIWIPWIAVAALIAVVVTLNIKIRTLNDELQWQSSRAASLAANNSRAQEVVDALTAPSAQHVLLTVSKLSPLATGRAVYWAERGDLIFQAYDLHPLRGNVTYELWVIPANGTAPIAAGLFRPDGAGSASVVLPPLPKGVPAKAFGVTIERAEGSARPTLPIILSGTGE